jgi:hypothetical protein
VEHSVFEKFKPYIGRHDLPNDFYPVSLASITDAEERLGYSLPSELRAFYEEVGSGFFTIGVKDSERDPSLVNRVVSPMGIVELLFDTTCQYRPYEGFVEGVLPFFDCGEGTFLVLRPRSSNPNAVYWPSGVESQRITSSVISFFDELYERAGFYRERGVG